MMTWVCDNVGEKEYLFTRKISELVSGGGGKSLAPKNQG